MVSEEPSRKKTSSIHGEVKQFKRDNIMKNFRNRTIRILVITDLL